jgi:hypothetical protein
VSVVADYGLRPAEQLGGDPGPPGHLVDVDLLALKEAVDVAVAGDDEPVVLLDRSRLSELRDEPEPRRIGRCGCAMAATSSSGSL